MLKHKKIHYELTTWNVSTIYWGKVHISRNNKKDTENKEQKKNEIKLNKYQVFIGSEM